MTANAVALAPETTDYLDGQSIGLILRLDGRPEVHDRFPPAPGG